MLYVHCLQIHQNMISRVQVVWTVFMETIKESGSGESVAAYYSLITL